MPSARSSARPVLLDTHAWFWFMSGDRRMDKPALVRLIERAAEHGEAFVSVMSVWEIGMLEAKGRIRLSCSVFEWVHKAIGEGGIALADLTPDIAVESTRLEGAQGLDPVDKILIATAKSLGAAFLTRDEAVLSFAKRHLLEAVEI
ncbi:MAG: type II toxin-antitoxin system VapC family toxin [Candidatus Omnitrophica bacterium]|nr:type II toxin-antitoxin system VapC family toxin [Candidatus Omnitrophota bacterium]